MRGALALLGLAWAACQQPNYGATPFLCQQSARCPEGYRCVAGICRRGSLAPDAASEGGPPPDRALPQPDLAPAADRGVDGASTPDARSDGAPSCVPPTTPCDDGNPCTTGDACTAGGLCAGQPEPQGKSCGALRAEVCCSGRCVNLSKDAAHCGGCGLACAAGYSCGDAASPPKCDQSPANTSGRCRCASGQSALCPQGQGCRTNTPANDWCSPDNASQCAPGERVELVANCPNYCTY